MEKTYSLKGIKNDVVKGILVLGGFLVILMAMQALRI